MISKIRSENKLSSSVRKRKKYGDAVAEPLEDVVTDIPTQDDEREDELKTQTPQYRAPVDLHTENSRLSVTKRPLKIVGSSFTSAGLCEKT